METHSVYRLAIPTGEFYIGKTTLRLKDRLWKHKGRGNNGGIASKYKDKDFSEATIELVEEWKEGCDETFSQMEDRHIRLHLENPLCLNNNRGLRTAEEIKEQKKESYVKYMAEHPEKKAEYAKKYNETHKEEKKARDKEYYQRNKERILANIKVKRIKAE